MTALSTPTIVVNEITIPVKPNSLKYTEGFGERKIRVESAGGARRNIVITEDVETQFSEFSFTVYTKTDSIAAHRDWLERLSANTVRWLEAGESRTITNATVTNNAEISSGVEGEFEVMFQGDPAV